MWDIDAIELIARVWVYQVGGDSLGFDLLSKKISEKIKELNNEGR